jgi:hypothetical protein
MLFTSSITSWEMGFWRGSIAMRLVLLEIKAVDGLEHAHERQVLNYLKSTKLAVALILNFGPKPKVIRKVFDNELKAFITEQIHTQPQPDP